MQIDLKNPSALTLDAVRQLLASKDDSQHRQIRVTKDGIAYLSDEVGANNIGGLAFRFETWDAGNGYCGAEAASDDKFVKGGVRRPQGKLAQPEIYIHRLLNG